MYSIWVMRPVCPGVAVFPLPHPKANTGAWRPERRGDSVTSALKRLQKSDRTHPPTPYLRDETVPWREQAWHSERLSLGTSAFYVGEGWRRWARGDWYMILAVDHEEGGKGEGGTSKGLRP